MTSLTSTILPHRNYKESLGDGRRGKDAKLKDPFAYGKYDFEKEIRIPKGYIWVIGDNRNDSLSGLFKIDKIFGMIVW